MADNIKTVTLSGSEICVNISGRNCNIHNQSSGMIYASIRGRIVPDADGVLSVPAGSAGRLYDTCGMIYLMGSGKVQLVGSDYASDCLSAVNGSSGAVSFVTASNPNLLINPDFKINQRGKSGVISDAGYFIDRWQLVSGTAEITADGILLNGVMKQIIENPAGSDVAVSSSSGSPGYDNTTKTFTLSANSKLINWAKLELGGTATPFVPPDPTLELIKCQRYYQVSRQILPCTTCNSPDGCFFNGSLPVEMRAIPNVILPEFDTSSPIVRTEVVNGSVTGWRKGNYTRGNTVSTFQVALINSNTNNHSPNLWYHGELYPIGLDAEL